MLAGIRQLAGVQMTNWNNSSKNERLSLCSNENFYLCQQPEKGKQTKKEGAIQAQKIWPTKLRVVWRSGRADKNCLNKKSVKIIYKKNYDQLKGVFSIQKFWFLPLKVQGKETMALADHNRYHLAVHHLQNYFLIYQTGLGTRWKRKTNCQAANQINQLIMRKHSQEPNVKWDSIRRSSTIPGLFVQSIKKKTE